LTLSPWQQPPTNALIVPIPDSEAGAPLGFLIAGLNPNRALDERYRGFIDLLTGQIAAAIARADAFERERARAEALAELDRAKTAFFSNISHADCVKSLP
jgi:GAF domain-containing protein